MNLYFNFNLSCCLLVTKLWNSLLVLITRLYAWILRQGSGGLPFPLRIFPFRPWTCVSFIAGGSSSVPPRESSICLNWACTQRQNALSLVQLPLSKMRSPEGRWGFWSYPDNKEVFGAPCCMFPLKSGGYFNFIFLPHNNTLGLS